MIRGRLVALASAGALGISVLAGGTAMAAGGSVVYNSTESPLPGNVVSWPFQAAQTSQFGDQVTLGAGPRVIRSTTVTMSSWGCQAGAWYSNDCATTAGATFPVPITFNVYKVGPANAVGALLATRTQTFAIPYRPSASASCTGADAGKWYQASSATCFNGLAANITFDFSSTPVVLDNSVIFGVVFNTSGYGPTPYGYSTACASSAQGCPYDSLNVGLSQNHVTVGSRPQFGGNYDYLNSATPGNYCDDGNAGTGAFRLDSAQTSTPPGQCQGNTPSVWFGGYAPAVQISAVFPTPSSKDACKDGGWQTLARADGSAFKNQGDCVSYTNNGK